jgi:hypothetical protein
VHKIVPFPRFQQQMIDWLELDHRQHAMYLLFEVDVTKNIPQSVPNIEDLRLSDRRAVSFSPEIAQYEASNGLLRHACRPMVSVGGVL